MSAFQQSWACYLSLCLILQQEAAHYAIGLKVLNHLVGEINQVSFIRYAN